MKVVVISKNTFNVIELTGVTNIAYASETFTITHGGGTATYAAADYRISIIW